MTLRWMVFEDTSFVVGDDGAVINIMDNLSSGTSYHRASGYIACDGVGSIGVQIAETPNDYCDQMLLKAGEVISLDQSRIGYIKLNYIADSAYRIVVIPVE